MSKKSYRLFKVSFSANVDKGLIKVSYFPKLEDSKPQERDHYINALLSGVDMAMSTLFADLPVLRPATEEERAAEVYIFKDEEKDNGLYKARKAIYTAVANTFTGILSRLFPDVEYIDQCVQHQQEFAFDASPNAMEDHLETLSILTQKIREEKEEN